MNAVTMSAGTATNYPLLHLKSATSPAFPANLSLPSTHATPKPLSITCSSTTTLQTSPPATAAYSDRVFNFAAGPATLSENVLLKAQSELYDWNGSGMSVMEMSHRGKEFLSIIQKAESNLQNLLNIPSNYSVLFLQGGATTQFAAIPLNLCKPDDVVDYVVTGSWSDKAYKEAGKYCSPKSIWNRKSEKFTIILSFDSLQQTPHARYLHICANETIHGARSWFFVSINNQSSSTTVAQFQFNIVVAQTQMDMKPHQFMRLSIHTTFTPWGCSTLYTAADFELKKKISESSRSERRRSVEDVAVQEILGYFDLILRYK